MILFLVGMVGGTSLFYLIFRIKRGGFLALANEIIHHAELAATKRTAACDLALKEREYESKEQIEREKQQMRANNTKISEQLERREQKVELLSQQLDKRRSELERRAHELSHKEQENAHMKGVNEQLQEQLTQMLEASSGLSSDEAKSKLETHLQTRWEAQFCALYNQRREAFEEEAQREAKRLLFTAMQRIALPATSEVTVTTLTLPHEEMKGRIIGRDGKNIRAFEERAGVNLVIDEGPRTILISSFDPIRRAVAQGALSELIQDGRIHPTRIEEAIERALVRIDKRIKAEGERALHEAKILSIHPELVILLGKLAFSHCLGQNVLNHSIEVAHLMGLIADEVGLDGDLARRIGLLHDIGKATPHNEMGSHAMIGMQIAEKYGEKREVANGIGAHHDEISAETVEATLCGTANTLSSNRPGARSQNTDPFIRRLTRLEATALRFDGVVKAYALQAGKELRVIVEPTRISENGLKALAQKIAQALAEELPFAGKIRVTAIREHRVIEYAT